MIEVSAQYGESTGKELLASVLGKWRESHKGVLCLSCILRDREKCAILWLKNVASYFRSKVICLESYLIKKSGSTDKYILFIYIYYKCMHIFFDGLLSR